MVLSRWKRRKGEPRLRGFISRKMSSLLLVCLAFVAILPPLFFHFKLRHFRQMQLKKCIWLDNPPLVCAHGGDSSKAFPNTVAAYRIALEAQVDCIEIDVSRSLDGSLFALHDRDLQRLLGNSSCKVGQLSTEEIEDLDARKEFPLDFQDAGVPKVQDVLKLISASVRKVILDAKVGPPSYERDLAKDILYVVGKSFCENCLIWAKSDNLVRDVIKQSSDVTVGYIVMVDPSTGTRTNLLRIRDAEVVGVYYPLINEKMVKILHQRNKKVYAWTVDEESSMRKMLYQCVDAIITSNPTLLQHVMQEIRTECVEEGFSLLSLGLPKV